jgi:hypothetical protein
MAALLLPLTRCSTFVALNSPPSNLASYLPPSVRSLGLESDSQGAYLRRALEEILEAPRTFREIHVKLAPKDDEDDDDFVWKEAGESTTLAVFAARLLPYAARLKKHGIALVDERGETLDIFPV